MAVSSESRIKKWTITLPSIFIKLGETKWCMSLIFNCRTPHTEQFDQFSVIPRHFIPPLTINALLGIVLWESYAQTSSFLDKRLAHPLAVSAISGAVAGGAQAIVAAPAENVRLVLEGKTAHSGWTSAWKDVFLGTRLDATVTKEQNIREARQVRLWMQEVSEMAGRGWNGWAWGFAKDVCGTSFSYVCDIIAFR